MRHVVILLAAIALVACSNDAELPTQYHQDLLAQPTATSVLDDDGIDVTWEMSSLANVDGYVVGFADTSGSERTRSVSDAAATSLREDLDLVSGTFWVVRVWAVDARGFFGPTSIPDTLTVP